MEQAQWRIEDKENEIREITEEQFQEVGRDFENDIKNTNDRLIMVEETTIWVASYRRFCCYQSSISETISRFKENLDSILNKYTSSLGASLVQIVYRYIGSTETSSCPVFSRWVEILQFLLCRQL